MILESSLPYKMKSLGIVSTFFESLNLNARQKEQVAKSCKRNCDYDVYLNKRESMLPNNSYIKYVENLTAE